MIAREVIVVAQGNDSEGSGCDGAGKLRAMVVIAMAQGNDSEGSGCSGAGK